MPQKKAKKNAKKGEDKKDGFTVVTKGKAKNVEEPNPPSYNDIDDISLEYTQKVNGDWTKVTNRSNKDDDSGSDSALNSCSNNNNIGLELNFMPNKFETLYDYTDVIKKVKQQNVTEKIAVNSTGKKESAKDKKFSDIVKIPSSADPIQVAKAATEQPVTTTRSAVDVVKERLFLRGNKVLIVIRGLPGSGKTTLAKKLVFNGQILAPEDFKKNIDKHYGTMKDCFEWIKVKVEELMKKGVNPIVIDNVHARAITVVPYIELAQVHRYYAMIEEPDTSWKYNPRECANRNTHNVQLDKIKLILSKYDEVVTVDGVLKMIYKYHMKMGTTPLAHVIRKQRLENYSLITNASSSESVDNHIYDHKPYIDTKAFIESKQIMDQSKNVAENRPNIAPKYVVTNNSNNMPTAPSSVSSSLQSTPKRTGDKLKEQSLQGSTKMDVWEKLKMMEDLTLSNGTALPSLPKDKASNVNMIEEEMSYYGTKDRSSSYGMDDFSMGLISRNEACGSPYGSIGDMADNRQKTTQIHDALFNAAATYELDNIDMEEEFLAFEANLDQKSSSGSAQNITDNSDSFLHEDSQSNLKQVLDQQDREFMPSLFNVESEPYNHVGLVPPAPGFENSNTFMLDLLGQNFIGDQNYNQFPPSIGSSLMHNTVSPYSLLDMGSRSSYSPVLSNTASPQHMPNVDQKSMNSNANFIPPEPINKYPTFSDGTVMTGLANLLSNDREHYPAQIYEPRIPIVKLVQVSTSTTPNDFNILHCIHEGIPYDKSDMIRYTVKQSYPARFKPAKPIPITEIRSNNRQADKSCDTSEINHPLKSINIDFLSTCFPSIGRKDLAGILDSCNGDVDKTVDVLLEWGYGETVTVDTKRQLLVSQLSSDIQTDIPLCNLSTSRVKSLFDISAESVIKCGLMTEAELQQEVITSSEQRLQLWSHDPQVTGVSLPISIAAIRALEAVFGLLPHAATFGSMNVVLPYDIARCVHKCLMDSFSEKPSSPVITENDELIATQLQQDEWRLSNDRFHGSYSKSHMYNGQPVANLREIMDEETANKISLDEYWDNMNLSDAGVRKMKADKLQSLFPGVTDSFLSSMFTKYNYNLDTTVKYLSIALNMPDPRISTHGLPPHMVNGTSHVDGANHSQFQTNRNPDYDDIRREALLHHQLRHECFQKSQQAFKRGWKDVASYYSQEGHKHTKKMREANLRAADVTFNYRNRGRDIGDLDLHGLHADEVPFILDREFEKRVSTGLKRVKIITGRGTHSSEGKSRVTPVVYSYLRSHQYTYSIPHEGAI